MIKIFLVSCCTFLYGCIFVSPEKKQSDSIPIEMFPRFDSVPVTKGVAKSKFISMFGQYSRPGVEKKLNYLSGDFTCDGALDYFVSADHPNGVGGPSFETAFVTGHRGVAKYAPKFFKYDIGKVGSKSSDFSMPKNSEDDFFEVSIISGFKISGRNSGELVCDKGIYIRQKGVPGFLMYFSFDKDVITGEIEPVIVDAIEDKPDSLNFKINNTYFSI